MRYSGIGGQAVMEGIMMKNADKYSVAVRKPDNEIEVKVEDYNLGQRFKTIRKLPILRGVFSFIDSLYLGMSTLMYSASFFEEEQEDSDSTETLSEEEKAKKEAKEKKENDVLMAGTVVVSVVMAIAIFFALPYFLSTFFQKFISSDVVIALLEGIIRLAIFIVYFII